MTKIFSKISAAVIFLLVPFLWMAAKEKYIEIKRKTIQDGFNPEGNTARSSQIVNPYLTVKLQGLMIYEV